MKGNKPKVTEDGDMDNMLKKYIHPNWNDISKCRGEKYYFVPISNDGEKTFSEIEYQLEIQLPEELRSFYKNIGYGFLCFNQQKKGIYRVLSPDEILDLYFEPENEEGQDDFITYRENAWENLENSKLLAYCLFGEEDSLLYIGVTDGAVYYLSSARRIADSLDDFLRRLDEKVDYFM